MGQQGLNARQQFIGLSSSKYGTVALGRQYAPGFNATANNDALDASNLSIQSSLSAIAGDTITPNSPGRFNNAITYTSPTFSGVTFSAIYGFGETQGTYPGTNTLTYNDKTTSVSDNGQWGVGLNYANGPINLDAVYQQRNSVVGSPALKLPGNGDSINEWYVGGAYDFQVVKIFASYQGLHNNNDGLFYAAVPNNNLWTVGLTAPIGRGTFGIGYGRMTVDNKNIDNGNSWGAGLMYTYPLSKRTALYAAYSYFSNSDTSIPGSSIANPGALIGAPDEVGGNPLLSQIREQELTDPAAQRSLAGKAGVLFPIACGGIVFEIDLCQSIGPVGQKPHALGLALIELGPHGRTVSIAKRGVARHSSVP